ncbi:hypothetical protein D9M69_403240 [compost metagenome]
MQPTTIMQLLAAALFISLLATPIIGLWAARKARATGFDEGHRIANNATAERIALLHLDIDRLNRQRDEVIQDADRRIAEYARRANRFTEQDLPALAAALKSLNLAADVYAGLRAGDKHSEALSAAQALLQIQQRLLGAPDTTPASMEAAA